MLHLVADRASKDQLVSGIDGVAGPVVKHVSQLLEAPTRGSSGRRLYSHCVVCLLCCSFALYCCFLLSLAVSWTLLAVFSLLTLFAVCVCVSTCLFVCVCVQVYKCEERYSK